MRNNMSDDIKYIIQKLDKLDERLDQVDVTLVKQHVSLEEHMRRSSQNEEQLEIVRKESDERLKKLESNKDMVMGGITVLATIGAILAWTRELGFAFFK